MEKQQKNAQLQQEDALEEVREDEFEGELELSDYLLIFEVDAEWPYDKEHYCFQGKYAYPLFLTEQAIKPCFPHFNNFFDVEGVACLRCINRYDDQGNPIYEDFLDMGTFSSQYDVHSIGGEFAPFVSEINGNGIPIRNLKV